MSRERYYLSNGFHHTTTYVLVEPRVGVRVAGATMRAAGRRLCPYTECTCGGSPASNPREGQQREGFVSHPDFGLEYVYDRSDPEAMIVTDCQTSFGESTREMLPTITLHKEA